MPHLDHIAAIRTSIRQIQTIMLIRPSDPVISRNGEILVGVSTSAGPDLHLRAVSGIPVRNIQTFAAVDGDRSA